VISDNLCIAAVADGLGSELYSDIASRVAVDVAVEVCSEEINEKKNDVDIIKTIKKAFTKSLEAIQMRALQDQRDVNQYDTTLSLAVLKANNLFFGHSGDSGIIALGQDGKQNNYEVHTIIGPLLKRKCVCDGFSKLYKLVLDELGIENYLIYGKGFVHTLSDSEEHAWNLVKIDNDFYHVDVTYDATLSMHDYIRYDYFLIDDRECCFYIVPFLVV
jgi:transglutaminase/protease-like cytokinesis protein 3